MHTPSTRVAPGVLAEEAKRLGALLVHYSTDYVFDGTKGKPYEENDSTNPLSAYGRTKLEGERAIQQAEPAYLIFRTAWVYAREGRNFLLTILRLAAEKEELRIVRDQTGAPTSSQVIAAATVEVLEQIRTPAANVRQWPEIKGIYHMTAGGETNWYEFAKLILELAASQSRPEAWLSAATRGRPLMTRRIVPIATERVPYAGAPAALLGAFEQPPEPRVWGKAAGLGGATAPHFQRHRCWRPIE